MEALNIEPRYTFATRLQDEAIAQAEAREQKAFERAEVMNKICAGIRELRGIEESEIVQVLCTLENQMQAADFGRIDMEAVQDLIGLFDVWRPEVSR